MSRENTDARRLLDYIFNTKSALNFGALFSDGTEDYRSPAEPERLSPCVFARQPTTWMPFT